MSKMAPGPLQRLCRTFQSAPVLRLVHSFRARSDGRASPDSRLMWWMMPSENIRSTNVNGDSLQHTSRTAANVSNLGASATLRPLAALDVDQDGLGAALHEPRPQR